MTGLSLLLRLYRLIGTMFRPLLPVVLAWRCRRGLEDRQRVKERLGRATMVRPSGRLVWVHTGEARDGKTLLQLVDRLGARGCNVLLSTRTLASANALKPMLPAGSFHQFMPLDTPACVRAFLHHWQPDLVLLSGSELWPNLIVEARLRGSPVILVNARLSERAYAVCRWIPRTIEDLLRHVELCLARTDLDAERYVALGAVSVQTAGDLAYDQPLPAADQLAVSGLASRVGARPMWVAAMVDAEEAALVLETHRRLLPQFPDLVTVLVPRRPRDGASVVGLASAQNLAVGLMSRDGLPKRLPGLLVADRHEEVGLFYRTGDIAFVGQSMTGGGRSPIAAAKLGCAILHGPQVAAFPEIYTALDGAQGGAAIKDAAALAHILALLFEDGAKLRRMQRNAVQTVERLCGGTSRVMRAIEPHLVQLLVESAQRRAS